MSKIIPTRICAVLLSAVICAALSGCGLTDWIAPDTDSSEVTQAETTVTTTTQRRIETTKTATYSGKVEDDPADNDDFPVFTTVTGGTLSNTSTTAEYDEDIRATMSKKTTTLYTTPSRETTTTAKGGKTTTKSTKATTTVFTANKLYKLEGSAKFSKSAKYKVVSDTTYLNLRFGPSRNYDIQLQIPNGVTISGSGKVMENGDTGWVYVTYKGTSGWVMEGLLQKL